MSMQALTHLRASLLLLVETKRLVKEFEYDGISHVTWYPNNRPALDVTAQARRSNESCSRFVYMGQVQPKKGLYEIIEAAERFDDPITVDVFGPLMGGIRADAFSGRARVRYCGVVAPEDVMPTLLALAGTESPAPLDGVNLVPTLRGKKETIREWLHFEHAPCYSKEQAYHALEDGKHKYIWRAKGGREHLFDLEKDPEEERDLTKDEAHASTLELWRERMIQRLANRPEGFVQDGQLVPDRPYPPLNRGTET